jgi:hypothetical protein
MDEKWQFFLAGMAIGFPLFQVIGLLADLLWEEPK